MSKIITQKNKVHVSKMPVSDYMTADQPMSRFQRRHKSTMSNIATLRERGKNMDISDNLKVEHLRPVLTIEEKLFQLFMYYSKNNLITNRNRLFSDAEDGNAILSL